jgi:hypothetical protein
MTTFEQGKLIDFFRYFDPNNENHLEAIIRFQKDVEEADPGLVTDFADWVKLFRAPLEYVQPAEKIDNSWEGITTAARQAGAKFPELVAAQWALESGFGKFPCAPNNFFGIKGGGRNPSLYCTQKETKEFIDGQWITTCAWFKNFPNILAGVQYVVNRWYKDFDGYKGVNRAESREEAARLLVAEGYATDPMYADKLIKLMAQRVVIQPISKDVDLDVQYFSQLDSETDQGQRMCFSSSCAMALDYISPGILHGHKDDIYLNRVNEFGDTTDPYAQIQALDSFGVSAVFRQDLDIADVEAQLDAGFPVPIGVLHKGPSSAPAGNGHWIVVVGKGPGYFLVNDPFGEMNVDSGGYFENTDGDHLKYSYQHLLPRWTVEGSSTGWGIIIN